ELELADIMLGSELTYMEKNVDPLIRVVKKYLKPDGVFYHVLSDDRTVRPPLQRLVVLPTMASGALLGLTVRRAFMQGVSTFLRKMEEDGWECHVVPVPE